jgi:predicted negative regulator of RcsB-dependent stress response
MESEAPPSAGFYNFLGWFETNKKRVAMFVAGLLVVGTVVGFFVWRSGQRAIEAEEALSAVKTQSAPGEATGIGAADALLKVANEYAGTPAAAKALLRAGTAYFSEGNYAKAQEQFNSYIQKHGETPWASQAVFGQAAALDAQNKAPEAIAKYNDFIRSFPNDPSADQARLNLARLYTQTQQPALALETLNKIGGTQSGSYSPAGAEAEEKKKELLAKNPALAPPPATPSTPNMLLSTNIVRASNTVMRITNAAPKLLQAPTQPAPVK